MPGYTFKADTNTGMTSEAASDILLLVTGGSNAIRMDASQNVEFPNASIISGSATSTGSFGHTLSPTAVFSDRIAIGQTSLDSTYELDVTGNINASSYSIFGGIVVGNANRIYTTNEARPYLQLNGTTIQITGGSNASTNNIVNLLRRPDTHFSVVSGSTNLMVVSGSGGGVVSITGNLLPNADNSSDLGSPSKRFANIHSADLQLSNEGTEGNDVDGTTGNWTLQEGEEDIYLINNKTGKKYSIMLKEVKQ